jgi:hypothetical protein
MKTILLSTLILILTLLTGCSTAPTTVSTKKLTTPLTSPPNFRVVDLRPESEKEAGTIVDGDTTFYYDKSMDVPPSTLVINKLAELGDAMNGKTIELIHFKASYFKNTGNLKDPDSRTSYMVSMYGGLGALTSALFGGIDGDICLCVIRIKMDGAEYEAVGKHEKGLINFSDCASKSISRSINDLWDKVDAKLYPG